MGSDDIHDTVALLMLEDVMWHRLRPSCSHMDWSRFMLRLYLHHGITEEESNAVIADFMVDHYDDMVDIPVEFIMEALMM